MDLHTMIDRIGSRDRADRRLAAYLLSEISAALYANDWKSAQKYQDRLINLINSAE